jgi:thymidylate synthase (FAD)
MAVELIGSLKPTKKFQERTGCEDGEDLISYCARVSNPSNQDNFDTAPKLLKYCIRKKHWSVFEMADVLFEINCTRDIGRQILRHRSFCYQEFSQRYAEPNPDDFVIRECRFQDMTNRQSSIEVDPLNESETAVAAWWYKTQQEVLDFTLGKYKEAREKNIAKEQARVLLPEGLTPSVMYMKGSLRSWFHYCTLRMDKGTQKEHRIIARDCWDALTEEFLFLNEIDVESH